MAQETGIRLETISKYYGKQAALDQVSFSIKKGEICGLVGQNGAGKTTLIRIISGLIKASKGQVLKSEQIRMGAIIESPTLYPNMSAHDNLMYAALQCQITQPAERVDQVLRLVGLGQVDKKKKVKNFSLGMRQRMAIALSLIDFPEFLILDEPINGLDPSGIKEMREIILNLRDNYGITVLISSHILTELELLADRFVIIHKGQVIRDISKEDLQREVKDKLILSVDEPHLIEDILKARKLTYSIDEQTHLLEIESNITVHDLLSEIMSTEAKVQAIYRRNLSLEDYYLNLLD